MGRYMRLAFVTGPHGRTMLYDEFMVPWSMFSSPHPSRGLQGSRQMQLTKSRHQH